MNLIKYDNHLVHELDGIAKSYPGMREPIERAIERILDTTPNDDLIELLLQFIEQNSKDQVRSETWEKAVWFVAYNTAFQNVENNSLKDWAHLFMHGIKGTTRECVADYVRENFRDIGAQVKDFFGEES